MREIGFNPENIKKDYALYNAYAPLRLESFYPKTHKLRENIIFFNRVRLDDKTKGKASGLERFMIKYDKFFKPLLKLFR